jgi:hypothetical protein
MGALLTTPQRKKGYEELKQNKQLLESFEQIRSWGRMLIFGAAVFFVVSVYCIVGSKLLPYLGNPLLDFIKDDYYYSLLLPLLLPTLILALYLNWLSMKFYRHN